MTEPAGSILLFSGARGDTRRYRILHLYQQAQLCGLSCTLTDFTDIRLSRYFDRAQLVILHRVANDRFMERQIQSVRKRGGLVLFDTDDYVFDLDAFDWIDSPDFVDPIREKSYKEHLQRNRETIGNCDAVLVSTGYLAEQIKRLNKPVFVHRNAFSLEMLDASENARLITRPGSSSGSEKIIVGYASGSPTHNRDFELASQALQAMMSNDPRIDLWVIGYLDLEQSWERYGKRVHRFQPVPWRRLPSWLYQLDINLAPLVANNPFGRSKSEIKYMEAAMVSVPTIASPTDAFSYAIQHDRNGLLAKEQGDWFSCLERLVEREERLRLANTAYQDVRERYHPRTRALELLHTIHQVCESQNKMDLWEQLFSGVNARFAPIDSQTIQESLLPPGCESHPNRIDMGFYYLRHRSPLDLARQVYFFFRRLASPVIPFKKRNP